MLSFLYHTSPSKGRESTTDGFLPRHVEQLLHGVFHLKTSKLKRPGVKDPGRRQKEQKSLKHEVFIKKKKNNPAGLQEMGA